ncbi:MAG: PAS domain S-box protein [Gemmatimonadota bacterium]
MHDNPYRVLFEHHPQPMWVYDLETLRFLAVNDAAIGVYGYSRDEFLALTIKEIRPPEDVPALLENVGRVVSGRDEAGIWRHRSKDGRIFQVAITSHILEFEGHGAELVLVTDVSDHIAAQEALAEVQFQQLRRYSRLLDLMRSQEFQQGDEGAVLRAVTEMVSDMIGVERVSVWRYTPDRDAITAPDLFEATEGRHSSGLRLEAETFPAYFRALDTEEAIVAHDAQSDPRTSEFTETYLEPLGITSMLDTPILSERGVDGVLCLEHVGPPREWTATERTFAVSAANAISLLLAQIGQARSQERFRLLSRATNDAIWDWDLDTQSLWWNEGFETLFGFRRDEVEADIDSWINRIHPRDRDEVVADIYEAIESGRTNWSREYRFQRNDGLYAWVVDRGYVIRDGSGKAVRMLGGMTDVSQRRALESQLRESQKMESVGQLAGGVAHDFNNLLTVIRGILDLHLARPEEEWADNGLRADLREVRHAAERATELTRQLLAFSRRQLLEPRILDLNAVVEGMMGLLRRVIGEDVSISFRPDPDLSSIRADPTGIDQVLVNLVVNARDAMPRGGEITIETQNLAAEEGKMPGNHTNQTGPFVELTLRDTGRGMAPETLRRCTEPFFTMKSAGEGTGLGLSTVHGIITQSGGRLFFESEVGRGTLVRILLPVTTDQVPEAKPAPAQTHPTGVETILLVEDDHAVRRLAARILKKAGYRVLEAGEGEEALEVARGEGGGLDLLLTDVVMPGMSGPELAEQIGKEAPGTKVVFTSGYTADAMDRHGLENAQQWFLPKPYDIQELTAKVREVLDRPRE